MAPSFLAFPPSWSTKNFLFSSISLTLRWRCPMETPAAFGGRIWAKASGASERISGNSFIGSRTNLSQRSFQPSVISLRAKNDSFYAGHIGENAIQAGDGEAARCCGGAQIGVGPGIRRRPIASRQTPKQRFEALRFANEPNASVTEEFVKNLPCPRLAHHVGAHDLRIGQEPQKA